MPELEPITREETLLDGGDLTPITRKEMFIKRIYDKNQSVPEPITREEHFLKKAGEGSGDVTIEQLNVTENGTYSESGKAYSPVVVNVPAPPIPENAYLLNNLSGLPADIASFSDGTDLPMASLKVAVTPYQDLHGYDGPWAGGAGKNKLNPNELKDQREWNTIEITLKANTSYTMSSNITRAKTDELPLYFCKEGVNPGSSTLIYSGHSYTLTTSSDGVVKIQQRRVSGSDSFQNYQWQLEEGSTATTFAPYSNICPIIGWDKAVVTVADDVESPTTSHEYTIDLDGTRYGGVVDATNGTMDDTLDYIASYNGETLPSTWISDRDVYAEGTTPTIGAEVVYTRATPITVQLAPTPVKSIEGENKIYANCGNIIELKYFSKEV